MLYENGSLVVRIVKIVFLLFFLAAGPLQAFDPDDAPPGSVRVKGKLRKRIVNSLSSKKTQLKVEESNEYRTLKASLELHSSQIVWLKDFLTNGPSSGLLFRNKDAAMHDFFENLAILYRIELENLLLLTLGEEADVQLFPGLSNAMPDFKKAFGQFFESLELIFEQAKEDLNEKKRYYDEFSEEFKIGRAETTTARHNEEEKASAENHHFTVRHVFGIIREIYKQYHFFSEVLPLLRVYFEEQLFMGQKVEPFNIKEKSKKKDEKSELFSLERQVKLRKRMNTLLDDHLSVIDSLNSILLAHKEKPVHSDPILYAAEVDMKKAVASVRQIIEEHKNEPWARKLEREVERVEIEVTDLFHIARDVLTNPGSDSIQWKVPSSSPSASPETPLKRERSKRKSSGTKLDWLKRTASKRKISHENGTVKVEEVPEKNEQDEKLSKGKSLSSKLHRKNKKNTKE
jgi:hypothetical protein